MTRRGFAARLGALGAGFPLMGELALAQRAKVNVPFAKDMVWLNANENPDGPPRVAIEAMTRALGGSNRYHYQEFDQFYSAIARSENLDAGQVLIGAGSSEALHCAVDAFTSPARPLITVQPVYELPVEMTRAKGFPVVLTSLTKSYGADVKKLAEEADRAKGGLIYLCNPNNPTSSLTPKEDIAWLVANLPANTMLLVDEAYIHFGDSPRLESALGYVRQGKNVIVTRTFSKIWGMAGLRAGFAAARPDLIRRMAPYINNVISYVTVQAVTAALEDAVSILPERKARITRTRKELCEWLDAKGLHYIEPQANFMMIDTGRDARHFITGMPAKGVAVGRPFPPLTNMLRVTIGTDPEMAKFREAFWSLYQA